MKSGIFLIIMAVSLMAPVSAQVISDVLTLNISNTEYKNGDVIVISGSVQSIVRGTDILIQITHSADKNIVYAEQLRPAQDGSFTDTVQISGPLWVKDGRYNVKATYGERVVKETSFNLSSEPVKTPVSAVWQVKIPDSGTFDVPYTIQGGTVKDMIISQDALSLTTVIDSTENGMLMLELPRKEIDAKTNGCEGTDEIYIVTIDGVQVPPQEGDGTESGRNLSVDFQAGDAEIEIIGTCVIPEFGSIAMVILAISIISIVIISRKNALGI